MSESITAAVTATSVLVNHPGPLPIKVQYTPEANVIETIAFSGSIYTGDLAFGHVGFKVLINGKEIGQSTIYTNDTGGGHHATVSTMVEYDIPAVFKDGKVQPVTIELVPYDLDSLCTEQDLYNLAIFM